MTTYFEVAVAAPLYNTLTYKAPKDSAFPVVAGVRVLVPLGRQALTGYCLGIDNNPPENVQIKRINCVLDDHPLFPPESIPFFRWAAEYYQYPLGEVIKTALPGGLSPKGIREIVLTESGAAALAGQVDDENLPWLPELLKKGRLSANETKKVWRTNHRKILLQWQQKSYISIKNAISKDTIKHKTEACVRYSKKHSEATDLSDLKKSERKTLEILERIRAESNRSWIARKDIAKIYKSAGKALHSLTDQGVLESKDLRVYRDPFGEIPPYLPKPPFLTDEQTAALQILQPAVIRKKYAPFLLHGVTGSGKTEVYLRAAETALASGRSVLALVPEIALATYLEGHFLSRFGDTVALLHSGLTAGEKFDQWHRIQEGKALIVLGARSAVFAPLADPGLIIVDEEHDGAYKQDDGFRYSGRDLAVLRARQQNSVVILGSATPSVTSYYHTETGKYSLITLTKRIEDRPLPEVEIVDLRAVPTTSGRPPLFSPQLRQALQKNFREGCQSLVFLNRRGYANMVVCQDCGRNVQCGHCNVTLTLHQKKQELICHYCGYKTKSAIVCPHCRSAHMIEVGFGTERIEEELKKIVPDAVIARLDQDTSGNRHEFLSILKDVFQQKIDILVGTQMIAKGHHFPNVTLVGVVWADAGLGIPDYRSGERTFQLLTQVFGRAGRGEKEGRVIVQTHNPEHYTILSSKQHDFAGLYQKELALRKQMVFPPFSRLINIQLEGKDERMVEKTARHLASVASRESFRHIGILGPAPAPISRLRGLFRWQLILKGFQPEPLRVLCHKLRKLQVPGVPKSAVKLSVDVDPENMV
jgi:primosomal protein N' (replication factor Y)